MNEQSPVEDQGHVVRRFTRQHRFRNHVSANTKPRDVEMYTREFLDWYHDQLKTAPRLDGSEWMTGYSALPYRHFRLAVQKGVAGYLRARDQFADFSRPTDFTQMNLMNSMVMPMSVHNPADKLQTGKFIPDSYKNDVTVAEVARVFDDPATLSFEGIEPGSYFLKSNHASAQVIPVDLRKGAAPVDIEELRTKAKAWTEKVYGLSSSQWWYRLIKPKVYLERDLRELTDNADTDAPMEDMKFHCINGKVALLQYYVGRGSGDPDNPVYDGDLNYMPYPFLRANKGEAPLPPNTEKARDIALALCKQHQYLRVDFYSTGDKLFLGELTFLPNSGRRPVRSKKLNEYLTSFWDPMPRAVGIRNPYADSISAPAG